jgi:hypothetical protein
VARRYASCRGVPAPLGGLAAEGERREDLGAEVDGEDLQHRQGQWDGAAGEREKEERDDFRRGMGEDVEDELADVVEDAPPGLDRGDDRGEVVVGEHHRRRLAGDVCACEPHRDADVGAAERRRVVDAVSRHRDDVALCAQGVGDP